MLGRRESVAASGYKIRATVRTDDFLKHARFDAAGWFDQATDDAIRELHEAGYRGEAADALAHFAHEQEDCKTVGGLFRYLTVYKPRRRDRGIIGFEVAVNPFDVYYHLRDRRAALCLLLFPNGEPEFRTC